MAGETEHPFARFIAILGRGKTLSRSLDQAEAREAFGMILDDEVLPEQLGAFLMLLRFQEESPQEIAGFVEAVRERLPRPDPLPQVDLDWSSYAGKRRQLPWFILSALLLAQNGVRVFMHGTEGHTPGRVYTRDTLQALGIPVAEKLSDAGSHMEARNFAYVPLEGFSRKLRELIDMRPVFGLRSPVHTISRMVNPLNAPAMLQGIFHRGFLETHAIGGQLIGQPRLAVYRGEGGEIERRVNKPTLVSVLESGEIHDERWPPLGSDPRQEADAEMDVTRLGTVWRGEEQDTHGELAVIGTAAIALKLLGRAKTREEADRLARDMWNNRDASRFLRAA